MLSGSNAEEVQRGKRIFKHLLSTLQKSGQPNEIQQQIAAKQAARIAQEKANVQAELERERREKANVRERERAGLLSCQAGGRTILYRPAILTREQEEIITRQLQELSQMEMQE